MKIAIGSDHGGFKLKKELIQFLKKQKYKIIDCGTHSEESCDYPEFAFGVAKAVAKKQAERGILICKSGIGNSIAANRIKKVRAALCYSVKGAILSRQHNDANVLALGSLFTKKQLVKKIIKVWLETEFEGGRHLRRVKQLERT